MLKKGWISFTGAFVLSSSLLMPSAQAQEQIINLVDAEASTSTKQLFSYLQSISGEKVLFGTSSTQRMRELPLPDPVCGQVLPNLK
nr:hypothetical protein P5621_11090 [Bacillus subtilis]